MAAERIGQAARVLDHIHNGMDGWIGNDTLLQIDHDQRGLRVENCDGHRLCFLRLERLGLKSWG